MSRRWLGRSAIGAWLALGLVAALAAPDGDIAGPASAEQIFGEVRSMQSSAPAGLLAFAEMLRRLGYDVRAHRAATAPSADALVLLAPAVALEEDEIAELTGWLRRGGRLIYAPASVTFTILDGEGEPLEEEAEARLDDEVTAALSEHGTRAAALGGGATLWQIGRGRAAVLDQGGGALANAELQKVGLRGQLGWLRWVLEEARSVAFDEVRIGAASEMSLDEVIRASRFWPAAVLACAAVLLLVLARSVRQAPPQANGAVGGRNFGEHLDGVAGLLEAGQRSGLALQAMLEGTRRRLGPRAEQEDARAQLEAASEARRGTLSPQRLARWAEALRRAEERVARRT